MPSEGRPVMSRRRRGKVVAAVLAGAWRTAPPSLHLPRRLLPDLAERLLEGGAGGLGWWRLRGTHLGRTLHGRDLRRAYRLARLRSAVHEANLQVIVLLLRAAGVEPLVIEGWPAARLYPDPGLRPYARLDLCVAPWRLSAALGVFRHAAGRAGRVDLHPRVLDLPDRTWTQLLSHSRQVRVGEVEVRVPGAEDQLRALCLRLLRRGARRPLGLCDVGAALEALPADFDWEYCLGGDPRLSQWVACVIGLARRLLGARVEGPELPALPRWLVPTVLDLWGSEQTAAVLPLREHLHRPADLLRGLGDRWRNPVEVLFTLGMPPLFSLPRLPIQLGAFLARGVHFAVSLARRSHPEPAPATLPFLPEQVRRSA